MSVRGVLLTLLAGALAAGCATSHQLGPALIAPPTKAACRIGVGRFADEQGVDHALDLRDYLRANGPCQTVLAVASDEAAVDLLVTGTVKAKLTPDDNPLGMQLGAIGMGVGLSGPIIGATLLYTNETPKPDEEGFVDPTARSSYDFSNDYGPKLIVAGSAIAALFLAEMIVDSTVIRETKLDATLDADVAFSRHGTQVDQLALHDEVTARGKHPPGRPEARADFAAHGPLYRVAMERIFDHIAAHLGELQAQGGQR